eukprot:2519538-Prymnesium_polylepis.1
MFTPGVDNGPLLFRRDALLELGGFDEGYSCAGDVAMHYDFEMSLRCWRHGYQARASRDTSIRRMDAVCGCLSLPLASACAPPVQSCAPFPCCTQVGVFYGSASNGVGSRKTLRREVRSVRHRSEAENAVKVSAIWAEHGAVVSRAVSAANAQLVSLGAAEAEARRRAADEEHGKVPRD